MSAGVPQPTVAHGNSRRSLFILCTFAGICALIYLGLASAGDLRGQPATLFPAFAVLFAIMLLAWRLARRSGARGHRLVLGAALLFRLVAAAGEPALSDDVYRYVWDGRVQLHGHHPYAHAPDADELAGLRDETWDRINHPELRTIYPPLAELFFLALAALGAGSTGFRLALGVADFCVVLLLDRLLVREELPRNRLVLYAWNPLAVLETSGSGHVEPLGVLCVLLAALWLVPRRNYLAALAVAAGAQVKLLPAVLLPALARRCGLLAASAALAACALPFVVFAWAGGPAVGAGLFDYTERWEHNAFAFAAVRGAAEWLDTGETLKPMIAGLQGMLGNAFGDWDAVYRHAWPQPLARLVAACGMVLWALFAGGPGSPTREQLHVLGGILLLSPTLHPWYLLWVLPLAAMHRSVPWLVFGATVALSYWGGGQGDVTWTIRWLEYTPPVMVWLWSWARMAR